MTAEELRQRFAWMAKLEDDADVTAIPLSEPGTTLTDGDSYVDATSPKRGRWSRRWRASACPWAASTS